MPAFFARREGGRAVIEGGDARHLARSLRARVGEEIEVVDPAGFMLTVSLEAVSPERVEGSVVAERPYDPEPARKVTIAIARLPAPALELALSRCTEAGAFRFEIFQADRSVARGFNAERLRTICREAAMLAERVHVPDLAYSTDMDSLVMRVEHPIMLVRDSPVRLSALIQPAMTLFVGPEGGWSERELASTFPNASLGPRNMRAETAALVGLAVALANA